MFWIDVIITVTRRAGELARELLIRVQTSSSPSQEDVAQAIDAFVKNMLGGPDYPRLQRWLEKNRPIIEPETIGVFRVQ